jgi:hypothetical protein
VWFSKDTDVLSQDLAGHKVWCNPPYKEEFIVDFLQHYLACKARAPETTTCTLVLPLWQNAAWWGLCSKWKCLRYYSRGTPLFTAAPDPETKERRTVGPIRWPVVVLHDNLEASVE